MSTVQIILAHPYREEAAMAAYPSNDVADITKRADFLGPVFEGCKVTVKEGCCTVAAYGDATYVYPLHTIARIKEIK